MIVLGLTGSIAMGKSTTAQMFRDQGIPVHDADATVHELYAGVAAKLVETEFPGTTRDGVVDRQALSERVTGNPAGMARLEALIHPLVRNEENIFLKRARNNDVDIVVLDIPLLFETGAQDRVDGVVVVTAPKEVQFRRVMQRPGMTRSKLEAIMKRQLSDREKRRQADFIVDTSRGLEAARASVATILRKIRSGEWKPPMRQKDGKTGETT